MLLRRGDRALVHISPYTLRRLKPFTSQIGFEKCYHASPNQRF
ncbi:hypothetical protein BN903_289 [Halorubrum sp. AJ67]|nr:hypothetical protein BN903_289 [Halorubrum sp. AJ67]